MMALWVILKIMTQYTYLFSTEYIKPDKIKIER